MFYYAPVVAGNPQARLSTMSSITLLSPAKVNLTLEILGKRADRYHEIRSIIQPIGIFDEVKVELHEGKGIVLESKGFATERAEDNLAHRAAEQYLSKSGLERLVGISVSKTIPVGAGLGGGSGNAAAVLVALNRLTGTFTESELIAMGAAIGADVPFFIQMRTALVEGTGERITPLRDFPLLEYVVVNPGFELSTREVYEAYDSLGEKPPPFDSIEPVVEQFRSGGLPLRNDLEQASCSLHMGLEGIRGLLAGLGGDGVSMTGSGPTYFCVFTDARRAMEAYDYLKDGSTLRVFRASGIAGWHRL